MFQTKQLIWSSICPFFFVHAIMLFLTAMLWSGPENSDLHSTLTFWSLFSVHKYWTLKVKLNLNWIIFEFHDFFMKIACTYNSQSFYCWFLKLVVIDLYFSLLTYYLFGSFVSQRFIISFLSISFWLNFVRQTWNIQTDANLYVIYLTAVHQIIVENVWISCF